MMPEILIKFLLLKHHYIYLTTSLSVMTLVYTYFLFLIMIKGIIPSCEPISPVGKCILLQNKMPNRCNYASPSYGDRCTEYSFHESYEESIDCFYKLQIHPLRSTKDNLAHFSYTHTVVSKHLQTYGNSGW